MARGRELGARVTRYETDNAKRRNRALVLLVIGVASVIACVLLGPLIVFLVPLVAGGIGVMCLWAGWTHARLAAKHPAEAFLLHEGGLVHEHSGQAHVYRWREFASATNSAKDNALRRSLGLNVHLRITLVGGGEIVVTGLTSGAEQLADAVLRAV